MTLASVSRVLSTVCTEHCVCQALTDQTVLQDSVSCCYTE